MEREAYADRFLAVVIDALDTQSIAEILNKLVASNTGISNAFAAAVITTDHDHQPKLSHSYLISEELADIQIDLPSMLAIARGGSVVSSESTSANLPIRLTGDSDPAASFRQVALRHKGMFYGLLLVLVRDGSPDQSDELEAFKLETYAAALASALARATTPAQKVNQAEARLSDRQLKIIALAIKGLANQDIASDLHVSLGTVKVELSKIFKRLGIASRSELYVPTLD